MAPNARNASPGKDLPTRPRRAPLPAACLCASLLLARLARADLVTPDMVGLPDLTKVNDQYKALGLVFRDYRYNATFLDGGSWHSLWLPVRDPGDPRPPDPDPRNYMSGPYQQVAFVVPGKGGPATTDSLRLRVYSFFRAQFTLDAYDINGDLLRTTSVVTSPGVDQWLTFSAPGTHSFTASEGWLGWPPAQNWPPWLLGAVEFQPVAAAPEPGGLALFALGALGLATRAWPRRKPRAGGGAPAPGG